MLPEVVFPPPAADNKRLCKSFGATTDLLSIIVAPSRRLVVLVIDHPRILERFKISELCFSCGRLIAAIRAMAFSRAYSLAIVWPALISMPITDKPRKMLGSYAQNPTIRR